MVGSCSFSPSKACFLKNCMAWFKEIRWKNQVLGYITVAGTCLVSICSDKPLFDSVGVIFHSSKLVSGLLISTDKLECVTEFHLASVLNFFKENFPKLNYLLGKNRWKKKRNFEHLVWLRQSVLRYVWAPTLSIYHPRTIYCFRLLIFRCKT